MRTDRSLKNQEFFVIGAIALYISSDFECQLEDGYFLLGIF